MTVNQSSQLIDESRADTPQLAPLVSDAEKLSTIKMLQNNSSGHARKVSNPSIVHTESVEIYGNARDNLDDESLAKSKKSKKSKRASKQDTCLTVANDKSL